jgi:hypothetical protein
VVPPIPRARVKDCCSREHGRLPKLSKGIENVAEQVGHGIPHGM